MKSVSFVNEKVVISGSALITLSFPPYLGNLASISPNVLETANLPGLTLNGPLMNYYCWVNPFKTIGIED